MTTNQAQADPSAGDDRLTAEIRRAKAEAIREFGRSLNAETGNPRIPSVQRQAFARADEIQDGAA